MTMAKVGAAALATFVFIAPALAGAPKLGLPIACEPGKTCWVQQYADRDPAAGVSDYACGTQTYDGHDGIDIRVRDTLQSAEVIAAAPGTVKTVRDGITDRLMRSEADRRDVSNRECGNGVVITHGDGWETQYCHMRKGSIAVKAGELISRGQRLGDAGFSGMAEFPHVHLALRKDGNAIDPFRSGGAGRCGEAENPMWTDEALAALAYRRGDIIRSGFAEDAITMPALEEGRLAASVPAPDWRALVAYVWAINLEARDEVTVALDGPGGITASNVQVLERAKAQYMLFAGKKRPASGWPKGRYAGSITVRKDGVTRLSERFEAVLD